jgi:nickel superoxide dismutase
MRVHRLFAPHTVAHAHCDLPCGVYDPAQARIEAESVKAIQEKYQSNEDPIFRTRALIIKEQRAELVKHHLWVLWTDYFKPPHFEKYPQLHDLFNRATKAAGAAGGKSSVDPKQGQQLLDLIEEISKIFWETKQASGRTAAAGSGWCGTARPDGPGTASTPAGPTSHSPPAVRSRLARWARCSTRCSGRDRRPWF